MPAQQRKSSGYNDDFIDAINGYRDEATTLAEDALFRVEQAQKRAFEATSMGNIREAVRASKEASESMSEGIEQFNKELLAIKPKNGQEKKVIDRLGQKTANLINNLQSAAEDEQELYREVKEKAGDKKEKIEAWKKLRTKMEQDTKDFRNGIEDIKTAPKNTLNAEERKRQQDEELKKREKEQKEKEEQEQLKEEEKIHAQRSERRSRAMRTAATGALLYVSAKELRKAFRYKTPEERNQPDFLARLRTQGIVTKSQVLHYMTASWKAGETHMGIRNSIGQTQNVTQKQNTHKQQKPVQIDAEKFRKSMSASSTRHAAPKQRQGQVLAMQPR